MGLPSYLSNEESQVPENKPPLIGIVYICYYQPPKMEAKRVILRLRETDFPDISYNDLTQSVEAYLTFSGRSTEELAQGRHFFHFQPPNPNIPQKNPRFHIIVDIEKMGHSGSLQKDFPHEIYRIYRRNDGM